MDKPLEFSSLYDLVMDYRDSYTACGHTVLKVPPSQLLVRHAPSAGISLSVMILAQADPCLS